MPSHKANSPGDSRALRHTRTSGAEPLSSHTPLPTPRSTAASGDAGVWTHTSGLAGRKRSSSCSGNTGAGGGGLLLILCPPSCPPGFGRSSWLSPETKAG